MVGGSNGCFPENDCRHPKFSFHDKVQVSIQIQNRGTIQPQDEASDPFCRVGQGLFISLAYSTRWRWVVRSTLTPLNPTHVSRGKVRL